MTDFHPGWPMALPIGSADAGETSICDVSPQRESGNRQLSSATEIGGLPPGRLGRDAERTPLATHKRQHYIDSTPQAVGKRRPLRSGLCEKRPSPDPTPEQASAVGSRSVWRFITRQHDDAQVGLLHQWIGRRTLGGASDPFHQRSSVCLPSPISPVGAEYTSCRGFSSREEAQLGV
jgi:hypothetical protein